MFKNEQAKVNVCPATDERPAFLVASLFGDLYLWTHSAVLRSARGVMKISRSTY
jgi:hypothetical protein